MRVGQKIATCTCTKVQEEVSSVTVAAGAAISIRMTLRRWLPIWRCTEIVGGLFRRMLSIPWRYGSSDERARGISGIAWGEGHIPFGVAVG